MPPAISKSENGDESNATTPPRDDHTLSVKSGRRADTGPDRSLEAHGGGNGTHTVVDITERRTPERRGDTGHVLDDLLRPPELSDDLLIRQRGHSGMTPSVHRELVLAHELLLEKSRVGNSTRADNEEGCLEVDGV